MVVVAWEWVVDSRTPAVAEACASGALSKTGAKALASGNGLPQAGDVERQQVTGTVRRKPGRGTTNDLNVQDLEFRNLNHRV